jgi:2'-phosphotransferase
MDLISQIIFISLFNNMNIIPVKKMNPMLKAREIQISKAITNLLRHNAHEVGLPMDQYGWVLVPNLLSSPSVSILDVSEAELCFVVINNDKQRYAIKNEHEIKYIRANQGHSKELGLNLDFRKIVMVDDVPTKIAIHGTYFEVWKFIKVQGLSRMTREHIHFAIEKPKSKIVISGMRDTAEVLIYIDLQKALADQIPFFLSENNVVLSPGINNIISTKYFKYVLNANTMAPFDESFPNTI